ncbi:predicted protein, partial [Nematostella vectensis]
CFPGNGKSELESGVQMYIRDLRIGDRIKTVGSSGDVIYSDVIAFLHKNTNIVVEFVALHLTGEHRIIISAKHLIFVSKNGNSTSEAIFADRVHVDDTVYVLEGGKLVGKKVVRVAMVTESGIYAPLTREGTLVVNGVFASCYA